MTSKKIKRKAKKKSPSIRHWLVNKLRRLSYAWPPRKDAIKKARVSRGKYKCAICLGENFGPKDINVDHIEPVIHPEQGFIDFNTYIERLFCCEELLQICCKKCHETKTFLENNIRQQIKEEKKKPGEDI